MSRAAQHSFATFSHQAMQACKGVHRLSPLVFGPDQIDQTTKALGGARDDLKMAKEIHMKLFQTERSP